MITTNMKIKLRVKIWRKFGEQRNGIAAGDGHNGTEYEGRCVLFLLHFKKERHVGRKI